VDAKTGKEHYSERVVKANERFRASPIYADGKIYTIGRDSGTVVVLRPGTKFEILASNVLPDEIPASPVVANGRLYIRGMRTLFAFSEGGK
jgi:outer membrane protein assembly factor BamB